MPVKTREAQSFVKGIMQHGKSKQGFFPDIPQIDNFIQMTSRDRRQNTASVTSAIELMPDQKNEIKNILETLVNHYLKIDFHTEENLIAGLRIQIGDFIIDTSFSNQLDRIGNILRRKS